MNRQARIDSKVAKLFAEFEARLRALGFTTMHLPASGGQEGFLSYQEARSGELSCATCEETGESTEWFGEEHAPGRNGEYQVRRGNEFSFMAFNDGAWEGGAPDAWRGIDWRISGQDRARFLSILSNREHGSKPDAALALIRHYLTARANDRQVNDSGDEFGVNEKIYSGVLMKKDSEGAKQVLHLVYKDVVLDVPPESVRQEIERKIATFDLSQD